MKKILDLLLEHKFFIEMDREIVEMIAGCGVNVHFKPGEYAAKAGESADRFYVIKKGKMSIDLHHPSQGTLTIQTLANNEIVGSRWIIPPYQYRFDVRCLEHTSVVAIDGKCIRGKCEKDPKLGYALMKEFTKLMSKRLENTRMQLLDVYGATV